MKDRIRQIMEAQHMTQQVFAQFIEISPAALSSIFNGRTKPTLNVVEAIKKKIPDISIEWLMFGTGTMYDKGNTSFDNSLGGMNEAANGSSGGVMASETMLDFDTPSSPTPNFSASAPQKSNSVNNTRLEAVREEVKYLDKPQRKVIEIRVFYDDQTWDTFVPAKK